jgi:hypothetical protein
MAGRAIVDEYPLTDAQRDGIRGERSTGACSRVRNIPFIRAAFASLSCASCEISVQPRSPLKVPNPG